MQHRGPPQNWVADRHGIYTPGAVVSMICLLFDVSQCCLPPVLLAFELGIYDWENAKELQLGMGKMQARERRGKCRAVGSE